MAAAAKTADDDTEIPQMPVAAPKKSGGGIGMLIAAVVISVAASGGISWFVSQQTLAALTPKAESDEEDVEEPPPLPKSPANYLALEPAFIVNLEGEHSQRFLQVQVEVMTREPKLLEQVQRHAPRIRSALLLLFSQQRAEDIATRVGKENLQNEVLAEIQKILRAETGKAEIEAVYFTSFVMQ